MATPERDPLTGQKTTGHEWDGIRELNSPLPAWWVSTFLVTIAVAVVYLWLYPSFASTGSYADGALGWTSRGALKEEQTVAAAAQARWLGRIATAGFDQITADPDLLRFAMTGGRAAFNENCAPCHGVGGGGQQGQFPALLDDDWIWGGRHEDILTTIRHGIRSEDPEARQSLMPAYGELLAPDQIAAAADYVLALGDPAQAGTRAALPGAALYTEHCAACHGAGGEGGREFGAPALADAIWLYGGRRAQIIAQITSPKQGMMPAFGPRLDEQTLRLLTVYVHALGGGE